MAEKQIKELKKSPLYVKRPIARVISLRLAGLVTIVTIIMGVASYFYSMNSTEELVCEQLMKYSRERGLRESALFLESDAYQLRFQKEYVERYKRMGDKDPIEWFKEHLEKHPKDGTYRSKPELYYGVDRELGRRDHSASMMVSNKTKITPEVRRALAIGYDMINQYGPAWRKPFVDLYFSSPEKTSVSRWPGTPWGLMMDDKVEWRDEEWMAITMKEKNPDRMQRWSGVLYDERNDNWMVSGVTPLDIDGKQVGMVGTDLLLDDLVHRTNNEVLSGTYNVLLQADGRIIAHPYMIKEIIAAKGQLTAQKAVDKHIMHIYERARTAAHFPVVIDNPRDSEFLAVTRIQGPGWYFITIYPKSLLKDKALRNAGFTLLSGLVSLLIMIFVILFILKRNLANPLGHLTKTLSDLEINRSHWLDRVDTFINKADELSASQGETGLLARSFVEMGKRLRTSYSELETSEEKHRGMIANISDVIAIMDINGIIRYKSPNIEKLFGWHPDDLINKDGWSTVHPDDLERIQKEFFTILDKDNLTTTVEYRYKCKNQSYKLIKLTAINLVNDSMINGILMNYHDITTRKQTENELNNKTHDIGERVKELKCLYAISTLLENPDISMEEIFQNVAEFMIPAWQYPEITCSRITIENNTYKAGNFKETKWKQSGKILAHGEQVGAIELYYLEEMPEIDEGPFLKEEKDLINAIVERIGRTIERKQAEKNSKKLKIQLRQAQKMESIGTLAGGIAHDFNNILFPIVGHTDMLIEDVPEDSPLRESLDELYTAALRAKELVKQILTFSRQGTNELKLMKLQTIIKEALKLVRSSIPTTIDIKQNLNPDCGVINADPTQIHQIVMNLTTNAYHAMEDTGGELIVNLKEVIFSENDVIVPGITPGTYACVSVRDTGIGMDKELTEKIFDPFFTTKKEGKGTGMGLSVVHGIVHGMGGAIQIYSEPGIGTQVHVYLPVAKSLSEKQVTNSKTNNKGGTEQILLIDDEEAILKMEKKMLERLGYKVISYQSSIKALEAFRDSPKKFDLVITDMAMPNLPGDKLSIELNKIRPGIPLLLCTGFSEIMSEEKAACLGIKAFLLKPIVIEDLSQKIREILDEN